jgi:hypothetical protein
MPLDKDEILARWIQFEDDLMHRGLARPVVAEEVLRKELPSGKWSPASRYVFGVNLTRFANAIFG